MNAIFEIAFVDEPKSITAVRIRNNLFIRIQLNDYDYKLIEYESK